MTRAMRSCDKGPCGLPHRVKYDEGYSHATRFHVKVIINLVAQS